MTKVLSAIFQATVASNELKELTIFHVCLKEMAYSKGL